MEPPRGVISNIERFALHDGPGIRTLVFMKGCPLRCLWCSSPQTQNPFPEILYASAKCQKCGNCMDCCPVGAVMVSEHVGVKLNRETCTGCGECVEACPNTALEIAGIRMTVNELLQQIETDSAFYRRSGGGVTIGGGEPATQHEFVTAFLKACKQRYIHTAIETCGHVKWEFLNALLTYVDLVYLDIKHMDAVAHRNLTGVSNELILENAGRISAMRAVIIRIPVVPAYTDSDDNISATAQFASALGDNLQAVELLPYHTFGVQTYAELGREYKLKEVEPPDSEHMKKLKEIVESCGVICRIGGQ